MYRITYSNQFKKDLRRLRKSGRFDSKKFEEVVDFLAEGRQLPVRYRDHSLSGRLDGLRECHIMPNLLLVYKIMDDLMVLYMIRIGSHSELF